MFDVLSGYVQAAAPPRGAGRVELCTPPSASCAASPKPTAGERQMRTPPCCQPHPTLLNRPSTLPPFEGRVGERRHPLPSFNIGSWGWLGEGNFCRRPQPWRQAGRPRSDRQNPQHFKGLQSNSKQMSSRCHGRMGNLPIPHFALGCSSPIRANLRLSTAIHAKK